MGKASKKPRQKFDPKKFVGVREAQKKEERDWSFEDIVRSKSRRH